MRKYRTGLLIGGYVFALSALAFFGYYVEDYSLRADHHKIEQLPLFSSDLTYFDLPRMSLTLTSSSKNGPTRVRCDISLEVAEKDRQRLLDYQPRISDRLVDYMRRLDGEEILRPNVTGWLRRDLLDQVNTVSDPIAVRDIIFRQFVIL
jgi:flagellar basal body-associated protein FliL